MTLQTVGHGSTSSQPTFVQVINSILASGASTEAKQDAIIAAIEALGADPQAPMYVELVNSLLADPTLKSGVSGTVSIPIGARLSVVSAVAPWDTTATVDIAAKDTVTIPPGRSFMDRFTTSLEGPFDIVFTGTEIYYVTYYEGIVPAEIVLL